MSRSLSVTLALVWLMAPLAAQIDLHGDVYASARLTLDQRFLDLPQRFMTVEGARYGDAVGLYFSAATEYRIGANAIVVDLREAYLEYRAGIGDFRFGKQIFAWGAADGNNPTDNVSPYDMYYLFYPGTERKIGVVAASGTFYPGSMSLETVFTPVFQPNRIPFNEPDFPIFDVSDAPFEMDPSKEGRPSHELQNSEYGFRLAIPLSKVDLSVSYFSGFDRMFYPQLDMATFTLDTLLYSRTDVFGGDLVYFLGDWALRAEGAYFRTADTDGTDNFIQNPYIQYVAQLDRSGEDYTFTAQYLGTYITALDGNDIINPKTGLVQYTEKENESDNITARMGMPFAAVARNAVMATGSYDWGDGLFSLRSQALYDLDHGGTMLGATLTITPEEAFDVELGLFQLGGDEESRFHAIKDFSHFIVGLKYSF